MIPVRQRLGLWFIATFFLSTVANLAYSEPVNTDPQWMNEVGGHVETVVDGQTIVLPTLNTDVDIQIDGDLAEVTLTQTFENPTRYALNVTYVFPLNETAAVYAMTMKTPREVVTAEIMKKAEAEKTFEDAKKEGKQASMLRQWKPNVFTQDVANMMPGDTIAVTLKYVQPVPKLDGMYQLVVPMVVGPRYIPANMSDKDALPAPSPVASITVPEKLGQGQASIDITLDGGMPVHHIQSDTHPISVNKRPNGTHAIGLVPNTTLQNRDFVLTYQLSGQATQAGGWTHSDERGRFFNVLLEPPAMMERADIANRELVFVLDVSGSMDGLPMTASKTFMSESLRQLRPEDTFRIVIFSAEADEFASVPMKATRQNIEQAQQYIEALQAYGGTEVMSGLHKVFDQPPDEGTTRMVVFLTDGYIGNETEVIDFVAQHRGEARLFSFGVGSSVNRYLLSELANMGRGSLRVIDSDLSERDVKEAARRLAVKLKTPALTDVCMDLRLVGGGDCKDNPQRDLFVGDFLHLQSKLPGTAAPNNKATVFVKGRVNGRPVSIPVALNFNEKSDRPAIALTWARGEIDRWMELWRSPFLRPTTLMTDDSIEKEVVRLGLDYSLMTNFTSFVAVSKKIVNPNPSQTLDANVAVPKAANVSMNAFGQEEFESSATPEPHEWLVLLMILSIAGWEWRRRQVREKRAAIPLS